MTGQYLRVIQNCKDTTYMYLENTMYNLKDIRALFLGY